MGVRMCGLQGVGTWQLARPQAAGILDLGCSAVALAEARSLCVAGPDTGGDRTWPGRRHRRHAAARAAPGVVRADYYDSLPFFLPGRRGAATRGRPWLFGRSARLCSEAEGAKRLTSSGAGARRGGRLLTNAGRRRQVASIMRPRVGAKGVRR
jgi:hypothetical protein